MWRINIANEEHFETSPEPEQPEEEKDEFLELELSPEEEKELAGLKDFVQGPW